MQTEEIWWFRVYSIEKKKNQVLLCKWLFKWQEERSRGWNKWIRCKYNYNVGSEFGIDIKKNNTSGFIKDLISTQKSTWLGNQMVKKNYRWIVNNGDQALF